MNITVEMVLAFVAIVSALGGVVAFVIARFGRIDVRCTAIETKAIERAAEVERDLAAHKVKAAESYVTMQALTTFEERLARTEERVLAETRSLRSDLQSVLSRPVRRGRASADEVTE